MCLLQSKRGLFVYFDFCPRDNPSVISRLQDRTWFYGSTTSPRFWVICYRRAVTRDCRVCVGTTVTKCVSLGPPTGKFSFCSTTRFGRKRIPDDTYGRVTVSNLPPFFTTKHEIVSVERGYVCKRS